MSFILDALRKLEEKQARESTRQILGPAPGPPPMPGGRRKVTLAAGVLLAMAAVSLGVWMAVSYEKTEGETGAPAGKEMHTPMPEVRREASGIEPGPPAPAVTRERVTAEVQTGEELFRADGQEVTAPAAPADESDGERAVLRPSVLGEELPDVTAGTVEDTVDTAPETGEVPLPVQDVILPFEELPDILRNALGDVRVSGHIYSTEPSLRRLNVNDGMWREGDSLPSGARIVEITERGAVFSFMGQRFFLRSAP